MSSDTGKSWSLRTASAPFGQRTDHSSVAFNSNVIVITGCCWQADVWMSTSYGLTWTLQTAAVPFGARGEQSSIVKGNNILTMGGGDNNGEKHSL